MANSSKDVKNFLVFLKNNNCLQKYKSNFKNKDDFKYFLLTENPVSFIGEPFTWRLTPEGSGYWSKIHLLWMQAL